jgi:hypothetical protein
MFLLSWLGCPNPRRMPYLALDSQLYQQIHKLLHRSGGFNAHVQLPGSAAESSPERVQAVLQKSAGHGLQYHAGFPLRPKDSKPLLYWRQNPARKYGIKLPHIVVLVESFSLPVPSWCPASSLFAGERASHIL